jgi:hypothetical protein
MRSLHVDLRKNRCAQSQIVYALDAAIGKMVQDVAAPWGPDRCMPETRLRAVHRLLPSRPSPTSCDKTAQRKYVLEQFGDFQCSFTNGSHQHLPVFPCFYRRIFPFHGALMELAQVLL